MMPDRKTDIPAVLERNYSIRLNDAGPDGIIRLHAVFDCMQDIASRHAELLGVGISALEQLGIIWVLSRLKLQMNVWPRIGEELNLVTWPGTAARLFCPRQYEIRSARSGDLFGCASSFWLMLNSTTLRPVSPLPVVKDRFPDNSALPFFFPETGKLPECTGIHPLTWTVGQSMIDYNHHLNNAYYSAFTQDWLASVLERPVLVPEIQINYNHSIRSGESLTAAGTASDGMFRVEGRTADGRNVYQAAGRYTDY